MSVDAAPAASDAAVDKSHGSAAACRRGNPYNRASQCTVHLLLSLCVEDQGRNSRIRPSFADLTTTFVHSPLPANQPPGPSVLASAAPPFKMKTSGPPADASSPHSPLPPQFARVKMASAEMEPFPPLQNHFSKQTVVRKEGALRRRKSSALGAELPGDSDVAAFATLSKGSPPASPTELAVCLAAGSGAMGRLEDPSDVVR